jgi:lipoprotein-releasing system ATP-binding protein
MNKHQAVLQCNQLAKSFIDGDRKIEIFEHLDFSVNAAETVAIMGASGSGKSTLLHLLGGLDKADSGEILVQGQSLAKLSGKKRGLLRNQHLGFVYQFHHLLPEFSALENVMMPLLIGKVNKAIAREKATALLKQVGLAERLTHRPAQLSGGERQRAAIARAMVTSPACILADEPTGNLDETTAETIMQLLLQLKDQYNTALVLVTHDQRVADLMQQQYLLQQGVLHQLNPN